MNAQAVEEKTKAVPDGVYLIINHQVFQIHAAVTTIGRKLENDIVIQDSVISRDHAEIRYEHGEFLVYDQNSTSGTYVNNQRVNRCALHSGDVISLANTHIMFIDDNPKLRRKAQDKTRSFEENGN